VQHPLGRYTQIVEHGLKEVSTFVDSVLGGNVDPIELQVTGAWLGEEPRMSLAEKYVSDTATISFPASRR